MRISKIIITSWLLFFLCLLPNLAGAVEISNPLKWDNIEDLVYAIIDFIFAVATALVPLMIVIAAFYFVTSAGNPQQITTAKKIILYTVIGYAIILLSKGLILVLKEILGVKP